MGSRLQQNPEKIFEFFAEVARPDDTDQEPFILQTFPTQVSEELRKSVPKFAFPCNFENPAVDLFTFTFTDIDGNYTFGFCRHTAGAHTCLCIISHLPWYEIFYKLLNKIAEVLNRSENNDPTKLLESLYEQSTPEPGEEVYAISKDYNHEFSFVCPDPSRLPSIPESRNITEYYNAVDANNMMLIFASMLYERRIVITSKKLSRMTACVHGCASLIYPMYWQHLYIPVLPGSLIDYLTAPMPFLIGVHSTLLERARNMELGDVVILDADKNTVETEYDDLGTLPSEIVSSLKKKLRLQQTDKVHATMLRGDGVARAFLRTLVNIIGGYRDALKFREGESIIFDEEAFINSRPSSVRPFLETMLHLQIFQQFIEERLDLLNSGEGFSDIFEEETTLMADKGSSSKYKEWMGNMKKQGKKFKREGRDIISGLTMRVKDKSKKAMKDLKSKIDELRKDDDSVPTTLPSHPLKTERPPRPPLPGQRAVNLRTGSRRRSSYEKARHYKPIELDDVQGTTSDDEVEFKHTSVGLLDDPDIQNALRRSWSCEDVVNTQSDEEQLLDNSTEDVSMLPVPAARNMRKNVSDTALEMRQYESPERRVPVAPPRRRTTKQDDAPLITLSAIVPDISDHSDSEHSEDMNTCAYEPMSDQGSTGAITNMPQVNTTTNMGTIERNKVKQFSQLFQQDITRHIDEQQSGVMQELHSVVDDEDKGMDTIERNKVKNLSQMFHKDITKHIVEQQTGKLYEPAYRTTDAKPKVARHQAFRDSQRPVPARRSMKSKKTDEIIQQLRGHTPPSVGDDNVTDVKENIFDPLGVDTHKQTYREVTCFDDSFVPAAMEVNENKQMERPQLSPNTDLLKDWDLKFDMSSSSSTLTPSVCSQSALTSVASAPGNLNTRSVSPLGNSLKIHVRGPYGSAGYDANPRFLEVTTYANQSNYTLTTAVPMSASGCIFTNSTAPLTQTMWTASHTGPNYSAINTADLMTASVFADKLAHSHGGQGHSRTQSPQRNAAYTLPTQSGVYGQSSFGSAGGFGAAGGSFGPPELGRSAVNKPQTSIYSQTGSQSVVFKPQTAHTANVDVFADLDPLKSMAPSKPAPQWESFQ